MLAAASSSAPLDDEKWSLAVLKEEEDVAIDEGEEGETEVWREWVRGRGGKKEGEGRRTRAGKVRQDVTSNAGADAVNEI